MKIARIKLSNIMGFKELDVALDPIDLRKRQRLNRQPIGQVLLIDFRREMINHAGRNVDGVNGVTASGEEGRINAGAGVELQQPIGGPQEPQHVIVNFAPHPRQIDVIIAERIVLVGFARKGGGHAIGMIMQGGQRIHS